MTDLEQGKLNDIWVGIQAIHAQNEEILQLLQRSAPPATHSLDTGIMSPLCGAPAQAPVLRKTGEYYATTDSKEVTCPECLKRLAGTVNNGSPDTQDPITGAE